MLYFVLFGGKYVSVVNAKQKDTAIKIVLEHQFKNGCINCDAISLEELGRLRKRNAANWIDDVFAGRTFISVADVEETLKQVKVYCGRIVGDVI